MIAAGIDCGAKNTKAVIMKNGEILGRGIAPTGFDPGKGVENSLKMAITEAGIRREDIRRIGGTGSGKDFVQIADFRIDDAKAISKAARFFFKNARCVADVGAEEGRAATIDGTGNPANVAVNEKCAAGAGAFIEAMARALELTIDEMGRLCLHSDQEIPLNTQCAVFAESEVVRLIHSNIPKPDISKAIHDALASRIASMIRQLGVQPEVVMLGGVSNSPGFITAMKRELKIESVYVPCQPEFGAAVGAAIAASEA